MNAMTELQQMRIAGERIGGDRVIEVRNPYTRSVVGTVPKATVEDIRRAFAIARAYKPKLTRYERYEIMHKAAALIRSPHRRDFRPHHGESGLCKKDTLYEVGPRVRRLRVRGQSRRCKTTGRCSRAT
jgi:aldehyde dehydrogenase (NAD+)